uniref:Protein kinase domain-containing protein n=1 Tax=Phytophthora fragariae TaxID=53985 RepID=A0A6A3DYF4_9STRA|nr:hypothetical protein PF009_g24437 [Phytophthora fragariae]
MEPTEETYRQFLNDMSTWSSLEHTHVLKLFGACHVGPRQFFLCEYAAHGSIDSYVSSQPTEERSVCARRVLREAALGLLYLHEHNVVHADLKCSNILVDASGVVKHTDFVFSARKNTRQQDAPTIDNGNVVGGGLRWLAPNA